MAQRRRPPPFWDALRQVLADAETPRALAMQPASPRIRKFRQIPRRNGTRISQLRQQADLFPLNNNPGCNPGRNARDIQRPVDYFSGPWLGWPWERSAACWSGWCVSEGSGERSRATQPRARTQSMTSRALSPNSAKAPTPSSALSSVGFVSSIRGQSRLSFLVSHLTPSNAALLHVSHQSKSLTFVTLHIKSVTVSIY